MKRHSEKYGYKEVQELKPGMDFRHPRYRREVFMRFYEFHLRYKGHAGAVYSFMPYISEKLGLSLEERLWWAFLNGCSQNPLTSFHLFSMFPDVHELDIRTFSRYFRQHYKQLGWDTDRRYFKNKLERCVEGYIKALRGRSQGEMFEQACGLDERDPRRRFDNLWQFVTREFLTFGRLSAFSYIEYLKIMGLNIECSNLFMWDLKASKSHRNGILKVCGRDDLDWHKQGYVVHTNEVIKYAEEEGRKLLEEAKARIKHPDIGYFTLETTLCCYKSWHRPNRRYPNVYNDMAYQRIKEAERAMGAERMRTNLFWQARKRDLPKHLRKEDQPKDLGLHPVKQNFYRNTGQVIMMDCDWDCFENDYTKRLLQ